MSVISHHQEKLKLSYLKKVRPLLAGEGGCLFRGSLILGYPPRLEVPFARFVGDSAFLHLVGTFAGLGLIFRRERSEEEGIVGPQVDVFYWLELDNWNKKM